ncbi:MAG: hypothetical protein JXX29_12385 [Deltaproteobacteria bacterium]|nr:hypothetical protein [Deltaproteobacteria bacterium]
MIEIFVIIHYSKRLAALASEKGRSKGFAALGGLFWFLGEIIGFVIGNLLGIGMAAYLVGIGSAILGIFIAFAIVKSLEPAAGFEDEALIDAYTPTVEVKNREPDNPYTPPQKI